MDKEHKRKIGVANSVIMKKKWQDPEYRAKMVKAHKGYKLSEETKKKMKGRTVWNKGLKGYKAGKDHYNWQGGISTENDKLRHNFEIRLWRKAVFERDAFTCRKYNIKGGNLNAHHINNFADFPELRTSIENGITLSEKAHKEFHSLYGKRNNTKEQLIEFLT